MINFSKVEQTVRELKGQVVAGKLDQQTFEARLLAMIDFAADGHYWMFGHKSESWYRYDGKQWVSDDPGELQKLASSQNVEVPFPTGQSIVSKWHSINWRWFIVSLIILGFIAWIVYNFTPV